MTEDTLFNAAKLGVDVERFFSSPVGRYLKAKAEKDSLEAIYAMKTVDINDPVACRKIQDDLNTPDKILRWLNEMVEEGRASEYQLRELEQST